MDISKELKEYRVTGRKWLTKKRKESVNFQMNVFASNKGDAETAFWYYAINMEDIKRKYADLISCKRIRGSTRRKKKFAFWITYGKRTGFKDTTMVQRNYCVNKACTQLLWRLGARRRAAASFKAIFDMDTGFISGDNL
ncbi:60S ribosomal protein L18a-like [Teleopsis dalmanni]|uniref:60S ribosomal protein L18a-like n=1 Tax=Teleopsis dalmanni TaxID=139649 RepID=UPI0018CF7DCD|nr:60S ribosomal protein L18a-like [Teleopsis dalmanni]